ncbi:hypothetical protein Leryth_011726 [Lithospermum erythrorhizon]|nr:hypothetical protein Leryth_011726 [Lithospermum erythrorhizon]
MYARKGAELVKEIASSEPGQLMAFNNDLFSQVIKECTGLGTRAMILLSEEEAQKQEKENQRARGEGDDNDSHPEGSSYQGPHGVGFLIHHASVVRNKRCLMAYVYNRAEVIRNLGWTVERVLPGDIEERLSSTEKEYFKNHSKTLQKYMSDLDIDLAVDKVPPKDPYIKVRVLEDIGSVVLGDQLANLAHHAILFLRRTDAEHYISQGLMEELSDTTIFSQGKIRTAKFMEFFFNYSYFEIALTGVLLWIIFLIFFNHNLLLRSKNTTLSPPPEVGGALPILGHLHLLRGTQPLHIKLFYFANKYGPIFNIRLVVSSPELARELFTTKDQLASSRPKGLATEHLAYSYANIGIAPHGPYWRGLRKIIATEFFSSQALEMVMEARQSEISSSIVDLYNLCCKDNSINRTVDIQQWLLHLNLNVMLRTIVGKQCMVSSGDAKEEEERKKWKKMVEDTLRLIFTPVASDVLPFLRWFDIGGTEKEMKKVSVEMDDIVNGWLQQHIEKKSNNIVDDGQRDFMDAMISAVDAGNVELGGYDPQTVIKATCMTMVVGGSDTSAVVLTWALSLLLNNRSALEKVQEELNIQVGRGRRFISLDMINKLQYLQAVVKETFRLQPAGPLLAPREFTEDCTLGGYHISKGTMLFVNVWKLQRDPNLWPDPLEFKPERFLTAPHKDIDFKGKHFQYFPFGAGRRMCPGLNIGIQNVHLVLANLLHAFDISTIDGQPVDMTMTPGITTAKATPLNVLIVPRLSPHLY